MKPPTCEEAEEVRDCPVRVCPGVMRAWDHWHCGSGFICPEPAKQERHESPEGQEA